VPDVILDSLMGDANRPSQHLVRKTELRESPNTVATHNQDA
jgi:hypothetical protein